MGMKSLSSDFVTDLKRSNGELTAELARAKAELDEAHQREAATAAVLKAISRSTFDLQKVLDTLVEAAARLCGADHAVLRRRIGNENRLAATFGIRAEWLEHIARHPTTPGRHSIVGRAMLEGRTVQSADVLEDPEFANLELQKVIGFRAILATPLLRDGVAIGSIGFYKLTPGLFSQKQVELVETFADEAVIAIENARLFEAEQERTRELRESLEYQTAISNVLAVISRSPTELQQVLDTLVESAARLCEAHDASMYRLDGGRLRLATHHGSIPTGGPVGEFTLPLVRGLIAGRTVIERRTIHVADLRSETHEFPESREFALRLGVRTGLCVPLMHAGQAIGTIFIRRNRCGRSASARSRCSRPSPTRPSSPSRTRGCSRRCRRGRDELTEVAAAADRDRRGAQASSAARRSISKPCFDTLVESAARLCDADMAAIIARPKGGLLPIAARLRHADELKELSWSARRFQPGRGTLTGRALLERTTVQIPDVQADPEYSGPRRRRSAAIAPCSACRCCVRASPIGVIGLAHRRCDRSPTSRSSWSRPSPTRR